MIERPYSAPSADVFIPRNAVVFLIHSVDENLPHSPRRRYVPRKLSRQTTQARIQPPSATAAVLLLNGLDVCVSAPGVDEPVLSNLLPPG